MIKKILLIGIPLTALVVWWFGFRTAGPAAEIEYRYAPVERGELVRSISSPGQLVALTKVDVKSKAGGIITRLAVEEGDVVRAGDLIAIIDPSDTQAAYDRAEAQRTADEARAAQAQVNYQLQRANAQTSVQDAEAALASAKIRLQRAELEAKVQPELTQSNVASAKAQLDSAEQALARFKSVSAPASRREVQGQLDRSKSEYDAAKAEYERQLRLFERQFTSQSQVDRARANMEAAQATYNNARQRMETLDAELAADQRSLELAVDRARSAYREAESNTVQVDFRQKALEEARKTVTQAEIALQRAKDNLLNIDARRLDVQVARSNVVGSAVNARNAKVQLDSATVYAPRDGVVTVKYLEEGTIIPGATSAFAQGVSLVELSDTTKMFVECAVDEADFAQVKEGQEVRIIVEAFPGRPVKGVVSRVNPAAQTNQNITAVKVRVEILPGSDIPLLPGMTATCEFITLNKSDVLIVPAPAVKREEGKTYVLVKDPAGGAPIRKDVEVGETGNDGVEILSGLAEGEEVVVAEIDLVQLRETQRRMLEAQQGGASLAGGQQRPQPRPATGGARPATGGGAR